MIKILHIVDKFYKYGGGELFFRDLLNHLDPRLKFLCSVVVSEESQTNIDFPIPIVKLSNANIENLTKECDLLLWWGRVGECINLFDIPNKVMLAHSSHNVDWFLYKAAKKTPYAICVSQDAKTKIGFLKSWVVYPGISSELLIHKFDRNSLRSLFGFSDEDFVVGQFGRLETFKNVEMTIRGLHNTTAKFFLIGDGPQLEFIINLCNQLLPRRYKHISYIDPDKIGAFYDLVDAMCISSLGEGCPRVMWETMQFKKPLLCTPIGAMSEIITDNQTGIFIRNENDLEKNCKKLILDPLFCQQISDSGHQIYLNQGKIEHTSKIMADIFEKIVKGISFL